MIEQGKKIYIIAGEASGDFIGGRVISALKKRKQNLEFKGIGGKHMQEHGIPSLFSIKKISLIGFMEVLPHIFGLKRLISTTVKHIQEYQPDVVITIDSPGFNFRVVEELKAAGSKAKFIHIVAPSVWAYKPERAALVAKLYDRLLTLLPFEPELFTKYGLKTTFIGHPIFEQNFKRFAENFRERYNIGHDTQILCVTPGSRNGEIKNHMGIFAKAIKLVAAVHNIFVVFPLSKLEDAELVESYIPKSIPHTCVFEDERVEAYYAADIALAKSGTNVLELSACDTPVIVAYKLNFLSYWYIKRQALIKYVSLVNILSDEEIIPEFIQDRCTPTLLANELLKYLENDRLSEVQVEEAQKVLRTIGFGSHSKASELAADVIAMEFLR